MKTVILIHGLFMNSLCFFFMKKELSKDNNLDVVTFEYNSVTFNDKVLDDLNDFINNISTSNEIVIIAHSLGGLVTRLYLHKYHPTRKIKVITLGSPHQGSLVAKKINSSFLFSSILGSATEAGLTEKIPDWNGDYPLLSIAGVKNFGITGLLVPENDDLSDGTVFLKETFLPNSEHMIFDDCHHFELISSKYAINKIKDFI